MIQFSMLANLLAFQLSSVILLKILIISTQCTVSAFWFNVYNALICFSKILIMPIFKNLNIRNQSAFIMFALMASLNYYVASILAMVMINSFVINILSRFDSVRDHAKFNLASKIGSVVGIQLAPLFLLMRMYCRTSLQLTVLLACSYSLIIYLIKRYLVINQIKTIEKEDEHSDFKDKSNSTNIKELLIFAKDSIVETSKDLSKYYDIVLLYFVISATGFVCSNISFLTGLYYKALVPCLALLVISTKNEKLQIPLVLICGAISHFYCAGLSLFVYSLAFNIFALKVRMYARKKYGDAYAPHTTAHLYTDSITLIIHTALAIYYYNIVS